MSLDREYLRKTAARWVDNENLFDELGEAWAPGSRDAARLASDYLDVLDEKLVDAEILKRVQDDRRHFLEKYRTLQARLAEALDVLRQIAAKQPEMVETYRKNGIVFDGPLGNDPKNWQHVAFSTYTQLCETETLARTALSDLGALADAPSEPRPSSTG